MLKPQVILALETSTSACSVALKVGENTAEQLYKEGNNLHSKCLLGMVDELIHKNGVSLKDVDLLVSGVGPGAFTGLRIGVGVAQGLAYSHSIPVLGVTSLQALAQSQSTNMQPNEHVVVGLDARMSEIYWTIFCKQKNHSLTEIFESHYLEAPENIELIIESSAVFVGNAWSFYINDFSIETKDILKKAHIIDLLPQAADLIEYALSQDIVMNAKDCFELSPLYIRNDIAKKKTNNPLLK